MRRYCSLTFLILLLGSIISRFGDNPLLKLAISNDKPGDANYQNCQTDNLALVQSKKEWLVDAEKSQGKITGSIKAKIQKKQRALRLESSSKLPYHSEHY